MLRDTSAWVAWNGAYTSAMTEIADQTRPAGRAPGEVERLVEDAEARTAEAFRCLH
jgi:hypothetical protein